MSVYISTIIDYWWSQVSSLCVSVYINEKILPREHRNVGQEDWGSSEENIVNDASSVSEELQDKQFLIKFEVSALVEWRRRRRENFLPIHPRILTTCCCQTISAEKFSCRKLNCLVAAASVDLKEMESFILGSLLDETGLQWTGEHHWCMFWCDNCNHQCSPSGGWSVAASELVLVVTGACRLSWSYSTPALIVVDRTEPGEDRVTTSHLTPHTSHLTLQIMINQHSNTSELWTSLRLRLVHTSHSLADFLKIKK